MDFGLVVCGNNLIQCFKEPRASLAGSSTSNRQVAESRSLVVFLASSLRLCVRFFFQSIDHTGNAFFDGREGGYRENRVIVEIPSVEVLAPVPRKQLLTYLRLADKRLGPPINFSASSIKDGMTRFVNEPEEESHAKSQERQEHE